MAANAAASDAQQGFWAYLELLEEEDGGSVGLEAIGEAEPAVEEAHGAVVAPHRDAAPAARAAGDAARDLGRDGGG